MRQQAEPESLTIRFNRWKLVLLFVPLLLLAALSLAINFQAWVDAQLWVHLVCGGVVALVVLGCIFLPKRYYLCLTPNGLIIQYVGSRRFYTWDELTNIRTESTSMDGTPSGNRILLDLDESSPRRNARMRLTRPIVGYDVAIFATFDRSASEIVELLHQWQARYRHCGGPIPAIDSGEFADKIRIWKEQRASQALPPTKAGNGANEEVSS
jgi:hypothetical protein